MLNDLDTACTGNPVESISCFPLHFPPSVSCLHVAVFFVTVFFYVSSGLCMSSNRCHFKKEK